MQDEGFLGRRDGPERAAVSHLNLQPTNRIAGVANGPRGAIKRIRLASFFGPWRHWNAQTAITSCLGAFDSNLNE
jgi:hypothetical protein